MKLLNLCFKFYLVLLTVSCTEKRKLDLINFELLSNNDIQMVLRYNYYENVQRFTKNAFNTDSVVYYLYIANNSDDTATVRTFGNPECYFLMIKHHDIIKRKEGLITQGPTIFYESGCIDTIFPKQKKIYPILLPKFFNNGIDYISINPYMKCKYFDSINFENPMYKPEFINFKQPFIIYKVDNNKVKLEECTSDFLKMMKK